MSFEWAGPRQLETIKGTVDDVNTLPSKFEGADRTVISLVDVTLGYANGDIAEEESYEVNTSQEGKPGAVLYGSIRSTLALPPKTKLTADMLIGGIAKFTVLRESFTTSTGETAEMRMYRMDAFENAPAVEIDEGAVLDAIIGKAPSEVVRIASDYKGTPYADILRSKPKTLTHFADKLVVGEDGRYTRP